jgi:hypothetical protein
MILEFSSLPLSAVIMRWLDVQPMYHNFSRVKVWIGTPRRCDENLYHHQQHHQPRGEDKTMTRKVIVSRHGFVVGLPDVVVGFLCVPGLVAGPVSTWSS